MRLDKAFRIAEYLINLIEKPVYGISIVKLGRQTYVVVGFPLDKGLRTLLEIRGCKVIIDKENNTVVM